MKEGVFWIIPKGENAGRKQFELIAVFDNVLGHSEIWKTVVVDKKDLATFDYEHFPRGRVWRKNNIATIFLNRSINTTEVIDKVSSVFELSDNYDVYDDT